MAEISWDQFISQPIFNPARGGRVRQVKKADELVTLVKSFSEIVSQLRINKVDFIGCSKDYVESKVNLAINDLKWIKERIKEI